MNWMRASFFASGILVCGCATTKSAVRERASQDLGCPADEIKIKRDEGGHYVATGCGNTAHFACHDPYASTGGGGVNAGWADPLTAGSRARCDRFAVASGSGAATAAATATTSSAEVQGRRSLPAPFDRNLAEKLLSAAAERAKTCRAPSGPIGTGRAHVTFATDGTVAAVALEPPFADSEVGRCITREIERVSLPAFAGDPARVAKGFEVR